MNLPLSPRKNATILELGFLAATQLNVNQSLLIAIAPSVPDWSTGPADSGKISQENWRSAFRRVTVT